MLSTQQMISDMKDLSMINLKDLKDLIKSGLNINEQDSEGNTYLHHYIKSRNPEMVKILCMAGANVNIKNVYGKSPIDMAWEYEGIPLPYLNMLCVILRFTTMKDDHLEWSEQFIHSRNFNFTVNKTTSEREYY